MYIKDKERVFQMYTSAFLVLLRGEFFKIHKSMETNKLQENKLSQYMNIINVKIYKYMIICYKIPELSR